MTKKPSTTPSIMKRCTQSGTCESIACAVSAMARVVTSEVEPESFTR